MPAPASRTVRHLGAALLSLVAATVAIGAGRAPSPSRAGPTQPSPSPPPAIDITHRARALQPGEVVALEARAPFALRTATVYAFGRTVPMWPEPDHLRWKAVTGIDVEVAAGPYDLRVVGEGAGGAASGVHTIEVAPKTFAERRLRVDPRFSEPPDSVRPRIAREAARLEAIFATLSQVIVPELPLAAPVHHPRSSPFGSRSFFNNLPRSRHNGVDFASPAGAEVRSPAEGRVVLADDLYFTGNTVVVDHGFGIYSLFAHFERTAARSGEAVRRGELLGWVGATGRATGPHLHWSVRVQGGRVDPLSLLGF